MNSDNEERIKVFDKATKLLQLEPLPEDIYEQLDALEAQCPPSWREKFADFYEAAIAGGAEG
jgi:hypothetical protein